MKKKIANLVLLCVCFLGWFEVGFANTVTDILFSSGAYGGGAFVGQGGGVNRNMLQVSGGDNSANGNTGVTFRDNFIRNIQVYIIGLLWIVSVAVFLYIGYLLFTADGKEEEFKKAWKALAYAVVGLAVIPLAYIAVKIVTGFTL